MKKEFDELLKQALTPSDEPDFWLNQKILNQGKERGNMEIKKIKRLPALALSTALILATGSITVFAAWKYLTPDKVAERVKDGKLTEAFTGADAIAVNEVQSYSGYDVTFLGIVSGENLADKQAFTNGTLATDRSYIAVAIENSDHSPMADTSDESYSITDFFVSVLIKGYEPWMYNTASMNGGFTEFTEDGVTYRLVECDNVEIFADCGLYLCVSEGTFYNEKAYVYDAATGEITRNEEYTGLNALFDLPIDASKGDKEAAARYIEDLFSSHETEPETQPLDPEAEEIKEWAARLTPENISEYCEIIESSVLTPDADGYIQYSFDSEEYGGCSGSINVPLYFKEKPQMVIHNRSFTDKDFSSLRIETLTLNEDGTVTFAVYIPKQS